MLKKFLAVLLCMAVFCLAGCSGAKDTGSKAETTSKPQTESKPEPKPTVFVNPLTGLENLESEEIAYRRPVAVMINNISVAQKVQTGLTQADIVYETEVEGGITRLMAVFQDITKVQQFGTVRSARYPYVDLAMGHNAIYVHHGQDNTYCAPHLKDTQAFTIHENNAGARIKNGLATEHTLYGYGPKLWEWFQTKTKFDLDLDSVKTWQNFAKANESLKLSGGSATNVSVPFSGSYKSVFKYDEVNKKYVRYFKDTERLDYLTSAPEYFKNVFVLITDITNYPDGYHRQVALESGEGWYCVNGTYMPILWSKGAASNSFKFTDVNGNTIKVNQGNSWVCIAKKGINVTFE
jgi:hypothetical protein